MPGGGAWSSEPAVAPLLRWGDTPARVAGGVVVWSSGDERPPSVFSSGRRERVGDHSYRRSALVHSEATSLHDDIR